MTNQRVDAPEVAELKLIGTPQPEGADTSPYEYAVRIALSRELTAGEQAFVKNQLAAFATEAGPVVVSPDHRTLIVGGTTIELVTQYRHSVKRVVAQIAAKGAALDAQTREQQRKEREQRLRVEAEQERQRALAERLSQAEPAYAGNFWDH